MEIILLTTFLHLLCGALGAYHQSQITGHGSLGQLYEALNTSEPIWLLKRSYTTENHECVYTVKQSLDQTDYEFYQYYKNSSMYSKEHLYARLAAATGVTSTGTAGEQGAKMTVRKDKHGKGGRDYLLVIWDEPSKCGILYVAPGEDANQPPKCEAHQWNQTIKDGQATCLGFYDQYCTGDQSKAQIVYNENCAVQIGC